MIKDKILIVLKRYNYIKKIILLFKNLIFSIFFNYVLLYYNKFNVFFLIYIFLKFFLSISFLNYLKL